MRKTVAIFIITLITVAFAKAQLVYPNYQDGIIYFKLNDDVEFKVNEDLTVDLSEFPTLQHIFDKYEITALSRPFYLFDNKDLLQTIRAEFLKVKKVDELIEILSAQDIIVFAEKVPLHKILWTPNDPYYTGNLKWHLDMIKADSAWNVQRGKASIKVAIIDNFVWGDHPDLQISTSNLCKFTASNKYTVGSASPSSVSIPQGSTSAAYDASHGTHCAGLVGAINNNSIGIASIGGGVTLMGVATSLESKPKYISYGTEGVQWAANNGANVISMSYGTSSTSYTEQTILKLCYDAGIVLVAAAGNEGDEDNYISYPAGYSTVIAVASVDGDGKLSYFSQWGSGRADIAAPGGFIESMTYPNILSTTYCKSYLLSYYYPSFKNTYYDGMQGTSMACPIVAGLCGLLLSKDSTLTPAQIKTRLQQTATPLHPASPHTIDGYGYINAYEALGYEYLVVSDTVLFFSSEANQSRVFTIESSVNWTINNIPSWLTINPTSGSAGSTPVTITTNTSNDGDTTLSSQLSIQGAGEVGIRYLTINQVNYVLSIAVSPKYTVLKGDKGSADTLYIASNLEWEIENDCNWLGITKTSGSDNDTIVFYAKSANTWSINRICTLVVKSIYAINDTIYIEQRLPDFIKLSAPSAILAVNNGSTVEVDLLSNVEWTITGGQDWVNINTTSGRDSVKLVFTALSENTSGSNRNATYTITDGVISRNLTITQQSDVSVLEADYHEQPILFPNPAQDKLNIKTANNQFVAIEVVDIIGKTVEKFESKKNDFQIDIADYPKGVYIIKFITASNTIVYKKFIKQ